MTLIFSNGRYVKYCEAAHAVHSEHCSLYCEQTSHLEAKGSHRSDRAHYLISSFFHLQNELTVTGLTE